MVIAITAAVAAGYICIVILAGKAFRNLINAFRG